RRGFYMFSIIYHAGAAVLFLVMSLAGGPGRPLQYHQNNKPQFTNKNRLCNVSTLVWIRAVVHAKQPT
ncbi:hypothetical protein ACVGW4_00380, partial [Enterobacter hormaechei]